jgi:hypothetical protein
LSLAVIKRVKRRTKVRSQKKGEARGSGRRRDRVCFGLRLVREVASGRFADLFFD